MNVMDILKEAKSRGVMLINKEGVLEAKSKQGAISKDFLERLSENKKEILNFLQSCRLNESGLAITQRSLSDKSLVPLSHAQKRMLVGSQLSTEVPIYIVRAAYELQGKLSIFLLEKCLQILIDRHSVLRTTFFEIGGVHYQRATEKVNFHLEKISLFDKSDDFINKYINDFFSVKFDLNQDLLIRAMLIQRSESQNVFLVKVHHIIIDGWSLEQFMQELSTLYNSNGDYIFKEIELDYQDYAIWENQEKTQRLFDKQLSFWDNELRDFPILNIPDFNINHLQSIKSTKSTSTLFGQINEELTEKIRIFSRESNCTIYTFLLTCFIILLSRYTRQEDIIIGIPVSNRFDLKFESIFGLFVNTIPFRLVINDESFADFLVKIQEKLSELNEFQQVPLDKIVKRNLQKERMTDYSPIFQVIFNYSDEQIQHLNFNGINIKSLFTPNPYSPFKLTLDVKNCGNHLRLSSDYAKDLFSSLFVERFFENYSKCIESAITNFNSKVADLRILSDNEYQFIVDQWNNKAFHNRQSKCIHQLFEEQVKMTPLQTAVICEADYLTYYELNACANQVASCLRNEGIKADAFIAIAVERSIDMVIGILGILKAGGAYVPLDLDYPKERIDLILEETKAPIVLTRLSLFGKFDGYQGKLIEISSRDGFDQSISDIPNVTVSSNLAYVIYTSGSTGTPKGVMVEHQSVVNLVKDTNYIKITSEDRVGQAANLSFDAATFEIWGALLNGAQLVIVAKQILLSPPIFIDTLIENKVSILWLTASVFNQLVFDNWGKFSNIRVLLIGGEALNVSAVNRLLKDTENRPKRFLNGYGPTESTTFTTIFEMSELFSESCSIPIGKPISNIKVYILDPLQQPVPIGVVGEIYISGLGLARGYLNNSELTGEKFIENLFASETDKKNGNNLRLYRTGDFGRCLPDGNVEYLGRLDQQIKLRGFRIELGEIEAKLISYSQIKQAVVLLKLINDQKKLVAYLQTEVPIAVEELRGYLEKSLPEYMIPAHFVQLSILPLNKNGKVDRKSLEDAVFESETFFSSKQLKNIKQQAIKPRNEIEKIITEVWQEILGVQVNDVKDNFFYLGGDSISLMQVVAKLRKNNINIKVIDLFEKQTVEELANVVTLSNVVEEESKIQGNKQTFSPIFHWFFKQDLSNYNHWNQLFKLRSKEKLNVELLRQTIEYVVNYHDVFSLKFSFKDNWYARYGDCSYEFLSVNLSEFCYSEQKRQMLTLAKKAHAGLNISQGPLAYFLHFQLGNEKSDDRLLIIIHHLIVDGVSWRILIEDLSTAYCQLKEDKPIDLLRKTSTYQQWTIEIQKYAKEIEQTSFVDYWQVISKQERSNITMHTNTKGINNYASQKTFKIILSKDLTQTFLTQTVKYYDVHVNALLLSPLIQTFNKCYGLEELMVDLEGHGRNGFDQLDVSRTLGWFTSIYPIILKYKEYLKLNQLVTSVDQQLQSVPNNGFEFLILKYMSANKQLKEILNNMKPSISFNYLGQFRHNIFNNTIFSLANEYFGFPIAKESPRMHEIDVVSVIVNDKLRFDWNYSINRFSTEKIKELALTYLDFLESIILASKEA